MANFSLPISDLEKMDIPLFSRQDKNDTIARDYDTILQRQRNQEDF
jgi:hypothetical protein